MMDFTAFDASLLDFHTLTYHMTYTSSTPTEVYQCPGGPPPPPPVTVDGQLQVIEEYDIINLPTNEIVYPWSYGTLTVKHL